MRIAALPAHSPNGWPTVHAPFGSPAKFGDPVVGLLSIRSGQVGALEGSLTDSPLLSGRELWQWYTNELGDPVLVESETTRAPHASTGWRHLYTGRTWDPQTRSSYYRHRWYDPHQARFLSRDALGYADGLLQYAYVGGDPVSYIDAGGTARIRVFTGFNEVVIGPDGKTTILIKRYHSEVTTLPDKPTRDFKPTRTTITSGTTRDDIHRKPPEPGDQTLNLEFEFWVSDEAAAICQKRMDEGRSWVPSGDGNRLNDRLVYSIGNNNCNKDTYDYLRCLLTESIRLLRAANANDKRIKDYERALEKLNQKERFTRVIPCDMNKPSSGEPDKLEDTLTGPDREKWQEEWEVIRFLRNQPGTQPILQNTGGILFGATPIRNWGREVDPFLPNEEVVR